MTRSGLRRAVVGAAVAALLGLGACGDSGDEDTLTKDEFVKQASAICQRAEERTDEIAEELPEPSGTGELTGEQLQESVEKVSPIVDSTFADLAELEAPEDLAERFDKIVADGQATSARLKEAAESPASLEEFLGDNDDPFGDLDDRFDDLGLTQCGSNE